MNSYQYQDFDEIENDLKKLYLEKEIAKTELKIAKYELEEFLKPMNWIITILKSLSKYGVLFIIKRVFK